MRTAPYNIVIELPSHTRKNVIKISRQLKKKGGFFSLGEKTFIPHITVYMVDLPRNNERKVLAELKDIMREIKPIACKPVRYRKSGGGYVDILYRQKSADKNYTKKCYCSNKPTTGKRYS